MVSGDKIYTAITGLVGQGISHTAHAQGEGDQVECSQMSDEEIEQLLAEALDAFDDPTPFPAVAAGDVGRRSSVSICQLPQPAVACHKSFSAARSSCSVVASSISMQYSRSVRVEPATSTRQDTHRSGVSPGAGDQLASDISPPPQLEVIPSGSPSQRLTTLCQPELSSSGSGCPVQMQQYASAHREAARGRESPRSTVQYAQQLMQSAEQWMAMYADGRSSSAPIDLGKHEPAVDAAGVAQSPSVLVVSEPAVDAARMARPPTISALDGSLSGSLDELGDSYPTLAAVAGGARPPWPIWPASDGVLFGAGPTPPAILPWPPDPGRVRKSW